MLNIHLEMYIGKILSAINHQENEMTVKFYTYIAKITE